MTKHTLYISFDGLSDPLGQSQIMPYICGLAEKGYHITVLSCEKNRNLNSEKNKILESFKNLPITWHYIPYRESGGTISRWIYILRLKRMAVQICKKLDIQLVHCRSYLPALVGLKLKTKRGIPFIFDMRGLWVDERMDGNIWSQKNIFHSILYKYFKRKEMQFVHNADVIVSLTEAGKKELGRLYSDERVIPKTVVIPCCTNTGRFDPITTTAAVHPQIDGNDHVIVYTGSVGTWYYTKEMIDCILSWQSRIPNIKLLIVTKDSLSLQPILDTYSSEKRKIIAVVNASYHQMPSFLKLAKAAIFFIKPAYSKIASSPTKMAECWAMNIPIITNKGIGDNDLYFGEKGGGILLEMFNEEAYKKACEAYLELKPGKHAYRQIALQYFNSQKALDAYFSIYKQVTK